MLDVKDRERLGVQRAREFRQNLLLFTLALAFHALLFLLLPSFAVPAPPPQALLIELTQPAPPVAQATVEPTAGPGLPGGQNTSPVKGPDTAPGKLSPPPCRQTRGCTCITWPLEPRLWKRRAPLPPIS